MGLRAAAARHPHLLLAGAVTAGLSLAGAGAAGWAPVLLPAAGAVLLAGGRRMSLAAACIAAVALGSLTGTARLAAIDRAGAGIEPGLGVEGRAHLLEPPRSHGRDTAAAVRLVSGPHTGARLLARGPGSLWPRAAPGASLWIRGVVVAPGPARDGFDPGAWLERRGLAGILRLRTATATGSRRGGITGAFDSLGEGAQAAVSHGLPAADAALARGLVLGRDEGIGTLARDDFRDSGLAHLLAASGQNVMLLCALAIPLLALTGAGPRLRALVLVSLIAGYVPLAGAEPSIQRAAVMGAAGIVAAVAGRASSRLYALLAAATVTLVLNPRAVGEPGWQLSFAAVAGIALLAPAGGGEQRPGRSRRKRLSTWVGAAARDGAGIAIAATVATAPLLAHHFGAVPLVAVPANVAALPAVAPVMWTGFLRATVGSLPLGPLSEASSAVLGAIQLPLLRYLSAVARRFAALADPVAWRPSAAATAIACGVLLAAGITLARRRRSRAGSPRGRAGAFVAAVSVLVAVALAAWPAPRPPGTPTISFLDVGQGDATLVQHPDGTAILVDGGPPEARVARLLRRRGVRRLDAVVATHASRDHHGGLEEVVETLPVRLLLDGGDGSADPAFRAVLAAARRRGVALVPARAGVRLRIGAVGVRILSPAPRPPGPAPSDPNPRAVVAVVENGGMSVLLSADAESGALLPLDLPDVDAMKVPHHGSADPGLPDVLARVRPEVAVIPVGEGNQFGHPVASTLGALVRAVPVVRRTDRHGTVAISPNGGGIRVRAERR